MAGRRSPITPTAHYTAAVWERNDLSIPQLSTFNGRLMYESMRPWMSASRALGGSRLEDFLLARHLLIDRLLEAAVERGEISQVIEIAAGLSGRGWRFTRRHGDRLTYVETDLPEMAERKRETLREVGSLGPGHRVVSLDALRADGEDSLAAVASTLDPDRGLAIITEGLLSYLESAQVLDLWRRAAATLSAFPHGLMLADLHLGGENRGAAVGAFMALLSLFVRGRVSMHFEDADEAASAVREAGFAEATLHRGTEVSDAHGADAVRVLEALTPEGARTEPRAAR